MNLFWQENIRKSRGKFCQFLQGYHIGQPFVQTHQGCQWRQIPTDLNTWKRTKYGIETKCNIIDPEAFVKETQKMMTSSGSAFQNLNWERRCFEIFQGSFGEHWISDSNTQSIHENYQRTIFYYFLFCRKKKLLDWALIIFQD